ncbi:DUF4424 domain-containing protein [Methylobacterium sp. J-077]|uniref:DUF4424 domain-containing protein n=1 Tax=Methylobacterium sp. J-077 TaxID=2836656 RepID=UPI001FBA179A|nr:DUF4424 domain-containing protein [Methylobacterium sp. J-077]MCJ2125689.1 DUF4424 domain-containing protein [Methylobacterium sp. J-077]
MSMRPVSLAFVILAAVSLPVRADDSSAALSAGGLVLEKTDTIALAAEDLYLSEKSVRIDYRFRNVTDADIETTIAFPMPNIAGDSATLVSIPDPAHDNFLKFETAIDGRPVDWQVEQRAVLMRSDKPPVEITDRLKALGIPLVPTVEATEAALRRLGERQRRDLIAAGILERQEHKDGTIADAPLWTLKSKFWRRQVFPAGREIAVRQSYVPSLGGLSSLSYGAPNLDPSQKAQYAIRYCTDPAFERSAQALYRRASADGSRAFQAYEQSLSYVMTSGNNGARPIGVFKLVVDKGDPATLVSFCGGTAKKIGPTTFEIVVKDYIPQRDIDILFLKTTKG